MNNGDQGDPEWDQDEIAPAGVIIILGGICAGAMVIAFMFGIWKGWW